MTYNSPFLLLFSVNLVYVVVCVYGCLLKCFYVPAAYKDIFGELFPARYILANMFMMQVLELPFIFFMYGRPEVLFCVNGSAMMFLISYLVVLVDGYFFLDFYSRKKLILVQHPAFACWLALLLPVLGIVEFTPLYKTIMTIIAMTITLWYLYKLNKCRLKLIKEIRKIDEGEFSTETDFPVKLARSVKWLPLNVCIILIVTFLTIFYFIYTSIIAYSFIL